MKNHRGFSFHLSQLPSVRVFHRPNWSVIEVQSSPYLNYDIAESIYDTILLTNSRAPSLLFMTWQTFHPNHPTLPLISPYPPTLSHPFHPILFTPSHRPSPPPGVVGNLRRPPKTCHRSSESWENDDSKYVIRYAGKIRPFLKYQYLYNIRNYFFWPDLRRLPSQQTPNIWYVLVANMLEINPVLRNIR